MSSGSKNENLDFLKGEVPREAAKVAVGLGRSSASGLGGLAQSVRRKTIKQARWILYAVGILSIVLNAALFSMASEFAKKEVVRQVSAEQAKGLFVDPQTIREAETSLTRMNQLLAVGGGVVGAIFIACGIFVNMYPVPCTVISLVLYLAAQAIFAFANPLTIANGLLLKIIVIVALFQAVKAALAYQREDTTRASAALSSP